MTGAECKRNLSEVKALFCEEEDVESNRIRGEVFRLVRMQRPISGAIQDSGIKFVAIMDDG
ncbi:MAG: hypothetical protein ACLQVJ_20560 [Syntrophobacteraceae bacterium]